MTIVTQKFVRKPLIVTAVKVTPENFLELALWCQGQIRNNDGSPMGDTQPLDVENQHIFMKTHNPKNDRQKQAMVGDWILLTDRGYKIYTEENLLNSFDEYEENEFLIHDSAKPEAEVES